MSSHYINPNDTESIQLQLKHALHTKNYHVLKQLLHVVHENQLPIYSILLQDCHSMLELHQQHELLDEISTVKFYIKQAIDMHSIDALQLSLNKAEHTLSKIQSIPSAHNNKLYHEFIALIETSKKQLTQLQLESSTTLQHYMKLSIVQRDQYGIQQALNKSLLHPNSVQPDVIEQAQHTLSQLDAQHTAKYYVKNAIQAKNIDALTNAISEANKLGLNEMNDSDIADAYKKLHKLKQKQLNSTIHHMNHQHNTSNINNNSTNHTNDKSVKRSSWKSVFRPNDANRTNTIQIPSNNTFKQQSGTSPINNTLPNNFNLASSQPQSMNPHTISLQQLIQQQNNGSPIPLIVRDTVQYIRTRGMNVEGVFRLASNRSIVDQIIERYAHIQSASDNDIDLSQYDINDVCGVLKSFLRNLSEPLTTFDQYDNMISAGQREFNSTEQIELLATMLTELDDVHKSLLLYLLNLLYDIQLHSEYNKMTAHNLAVVFTPTLIKPQYETPQTMINDTKFGIQALTTLIAQYPKFVSDT